MDSDSIDKRLQNLKERYEHDVFVLTIYKDLQQEFGGRLNGSPFERYCLSLNDNICLSVGCHRSEIDSIFIQVGGAKFRVEISDNMYEEIRRIMEISKYLYFDKQ